MTKKYVLASEKQLNDLYCEVVSWMCGSEVLLPKEDITELSVHMQGDPQFLVVVGAVSEYKANKSGFTIYKERATYGK